MPQKKKRKDGRYRSKVTLPSGVKKEIYGRTQKELKQKKDDLLLKYAMGATNINSKITVQEWGLKWWHADKEGKTRSKSQSGYTSALNNHIFPFMGTMKLIDVKPINCQELINKLGKAGRSESLQYKVRMTMNKMFTYAMRNGLIVSNPAQFVNLYDVPVEERMPLTPIETEELLNKCLECSWRAQITVHLALYCGLRREEIVALEHDDIFKWMEDKEERRVLVITRAAEFPHNQPEEKGTKSKASNRIIPIPDHLWELLQSAPKTTIWVVPSAKGVQMSEMAFRRLMEPVQRRVSFKFTPHMLRHTYATNLDKLGVSPKACQYLLGHAEYQTTKNIYTHFQDEHLDVASRQLKEIYRVSIASSTQQGGVRRGSNLKSKRGGNVEPMGGFEPPTC